MGQVSTLEDEEERRGDFEPRSAVKRLSAVFDDVDFEKVFPNRKLGLPLDKDSGARLEDLLRNLERAAERRGIAWSTVDESNVKALSSAFKNHKKYKEAVQELHKFLAPYVRKMRKGDQKRTWQRTLNRLQKTKSLF